MLVVIYNSGVNNEKWSQRVALFLEINNKSRAGDFRIGHSAALLLTPSVVRLLLLHEKLF